MADFVRHGAASAVRSRLTQITGLPGRTRKARATPFSAGSSVADNTTEAGDNPRSRISRLNEVRCNRLLT